MAAVPGGGGGASCPAGLLKPGGGPDFVANWRFLSNVGQMLVFACRKAARQILPFFNTILILAPSLLFPGVRCLSLVIPGKISPKSGQFRPVFGGILAGWRAFNTLLIYPRFGRLHYVTFARTIKHFPQFVLR